MIDYELLCQTIEDWRAGRRPSIDLSAPPVGAAPASGYAEVDPGYETGYEQGQYADSSESYDAYEPQAATEGYEGYEYDGSPAAVPGSGTSPMEVTEIDEYEQ